MVKETKSNLVDFLLNADLTNANIRQLISQVIKENTFLKKTNVKEIIEAKQEKYNNPNSSLAEPLLSSQSFFDSSNNTSQEKKDSPKPKKN